MNQAPRVLYLKSGNVVQEVEQLLPRLGELPVGGPDKFLLATLWLCREGQLHVVSVGDTESALQADGVTAATYATRCGAISRWAKAVRFTRDLFRFVVAGVRWRPSKVMCGEGGLFAVAAWVVARLSGAPFLLLCHNAMTLPTSSWIHRRSTAFLCARADWVLAHGPYLAQEARALRGHDRQLIEFKNALDAKESAAIERFRQQSSLSTVCQVVFLGRLEADKGVFDLLDACMQLRAQGVTLALSYIGGGGAFPALKQAVVRQDAAHWVQVHGSVPFEAVFEHLSSATVVVTPTRSSFPEGLCKAVMEAFFMGLPVVAPDYGPFPYLVRHDHNGLLFRADDVQSLTEQLRRIVVDPQLRAQLSAGADASGAAPCIPMFRSTMC